MALLEYLVSDWSALGSIDEKHGKHSWKAQVRLGELRLSEQGVVADRKPFWVQFEAPSCRSCDLFYGTRMRKVPLATTLSKEPPAITFPSN